jgi:hypothetical protein
VVTPDALDYVRAVVIPGALSLLPQTMDGIEARTMLVAIGMQESHFRYRHQLKGPALSFWQGEASGGLAKVFDHPKTRTMARDVLHRMAYGEWDPTDFLAMENNDVLACVGARLLLWTHPKPLPEGDPDAAWLYYLDLWRPGKPRRETWDAFYLDAWAREVS